MRNYFTLVLGILWTVMLQAQTLERYTTDLAGGIAKSDKFSVSYSIGQLFVESSKVENRTICEGFIQGVVKEIPTAIDLYPNIEVEIYPNPSVDFITIQSTESLRYSKIKLLNAAGQLMAEQPFEYKLHLNLQPYNAGTYILVWCDQLNRPVRKFRIIKL